MNEIVKINLDNEMDLILAHKRTLKLAELCGLSLPAQTTFATAVSEIARCAISLGKKSYMILGINNLRLNKKEIVASIYDTVDLLTTSPEAFGYVKRLMGDINSVYNDGVYEIRLTNFINFSGTITPAKIDSFRDYFKNEPPISPYDEIRKKNIQLIDLSNKLQESEKQYRLLTDTLPLMMFAINPKGEVTYSNKWLRDFFGTTSIQPAALWPTMLHADDYRLMAKEWEKAQLNKTAFQGQGRLKDAKGNFLWHLISIVPSKNEKEANWIGFFVDIHSHKLVKDTLKDNEELKEAQHELERYQYQLEEKIKELNISNRNLEQFAYIASHDLQEPLRKIKTFSNLLENNLILTEKQTGYFNKIKYSADRMSELIRAVLNYSRLSHDGDGMSITDLNSIVENVLIDLELVIHEKKATIEVSDLPVLNVIPLQITQLFSNLLHNALKFSSQVPVIKITCRTLPQQEQANINELLTNTQYVHISIADNGIGFEPEFGDRIFTIFQKLNGKSYPGTGIGLALCKKIVENHQGYINATSQEGVGSVFNIYLPL